MPRFVLLFSAALVSSPHLTERDGPSAPATFAADVAKPAAKPVPVEKTNCVTCHLTAGRELTDAVYNFAQSAHDLAGFSCYKCHGGDIKNDAAAHDAEFGFIGTKLSAHLRACRSCHTGEAAALRKGPHYWDHDQQINTKFPLCVDCHGNHDIGKPPEDFRLTLVCLDCHKDYSTKFPNHAVVTTENDRLWQSIRAWQKAHPRSVERVPPELKEDFDRLRAETAALVHPAGRISPAQAVRLKDELAKFRRKLEATAAVKSESEHLTE